VTTDVGIRGMLAAGRRTQAIPYEFLIGRTCRQNTPMRSPRFWWAALGGIAALRILPPLAALAAEGRNLPGLPRFDLVAGTGDDAGFYAAAREFISSLGKIQRPLLVLALALAVAAVVVTRRLWPRPELRPWVLVGLSLAAALVVSLAILELEPSGSAVFGWSLLWGIAMLPYRLLGLPLDYETAFVFAFPLALGANVVAVVATAYAGFWASGRRAVGLLAAGALAVWPLVTRLVAGESAWENGTWHVDVGLALYTEPLSTALVAVALALLLRPDRSDLQLALAGVLLSYATLVKLSNGLVAVLAVIVVALFLEPKRALPLAAGAATWLPAIAAYWPLGYVQEENGRSLLPPDPFSLDYAWRSWGDSLLFSPRALLVLLPLAVLGALGLRRRFALALLLTFTLANALFYSVYEVTYLHPRFLFASLPALFVLWAAGLLALAERTRLSTR